MPRTGPAAKEELVVYPSVRALLGDDTANQLVGEHAAVKLAMAQLDTMTVADPAFDAQVGVLLGGEGGVGAWRQG